MTPEPVHEHEYEPVPGLPEKLPPGEAILWQGRSNGRAIAQRVLKVRWFAGYFVVLATWALITGLYDGRGIGGAAFSAGALLVLGTIVIALLELYAWGIEKTTLYTITNRRIVMRIGVALPFTMNLPFARIVSADIRRYGRGIGDVTVRMERDDRVSWLTMWPHARALRMLRPEPALRCIANADVAAGILAGALRAFSGAVAGRGAVVQTEDRPGPETAAPIGIAGAAE